MSSYNLLKQILNYLPFKPFELLGRIMSRSKFIRYGGKRRGFIIHSNITGKNFNLTNYLSYVFTHRKQF